MSNSFPSPEQFQEAEAWLSTRGWVEVSAICKAKYWRKLNSGTVHGTVHAVGLEVMMSGELSV